METMAHQRKKIEKLEVIYNMLYEFVLGLARSSHLHGETSYSLVASLNVSIGSL